MLTINRISKNVLKAISIISYSLIILMGQMIGISFMAWLLFTSFDFGNPDQVFAIIGLVGLVTIFTKDYSFIIFRILVFVLLMAPILRRLTEIPLEKFNSLTFQIPLFVFIIII